MLAKISKNQTFFNSKSKLKEENSFCVTEALDCEENYGKMFSTTQSTVAENETFVTLEKDKCSTDSTQNLTTPNNAEAVSNATSIFVENTECLWHEKNNLDKNERHIKGKMLKMSIKNTNLEDNLKLSNASTCSRQDFAFEQLETTFYPIFQKMNSSNTLANKITLNTHIARGRHLETLEMEKGKTQDWLHKLKNDLEIDFFQQQSIPAVDFVNGNSNENQKINLLCVFTNEAGKEETLSNFNKLRHDEDIRMVLPLKWNIVVANNVLTISDENNQDITLYFRYSLKAKFEHKYPNVSSKKKLRCKSAMDVTSSSKERFQSGRKKTKNSSFTKTTVNQFIEPFNWPKNKAVRNSPNEIKDKETRNNYFLLLREPILFNCTERNRTKQVLMYKAHSVESAAKNGSKNNFSKTLEDLLTKSIKYDGDPVYLVSEPLKLLTRLKKGEKIRVLDVESNRQCKHNLIGSSIYKKLLQYKRTQTLRDTQYLKQSFRGVLPKNEYRMHINTINEISGDSVKTTQSCLDLRKNFSTSFRIKDFDLKQNTSQTPTKSFVTGDSCTGLENNFCASSTRRNFDLYELFGGNKPNFQCRMSMTALKHVNAKKLVSSVFRHFFHFYSLIGGNLRSGAVITRSSSNYWLQVAGVATDSCTLRLAGEIFTTVAGKKVVLNIFDYIKFLIMFARTRRLVIAELVKQMMICENLSDPEFSKGKCKRCATFKNRENEPTEFCYKGNNFQASQSLPNIWQPKVNSYVGNKSRNSLNIQNL